MLIFIENNRINILREINISLLRTIMLHWDEYNFQITKDENAELSAKGE